MAGRLSRVAGRGAGGTLPGRVASALRPSVLSELAEGRPLVLVSGTNGKSTTTTMLAAALRPTGDVLNNADGANLLSGLVSTLIADAGGRRLAVLEVDELTLPAALAATEASHVVLLNLSRDQLDRFGEVLSTVRLWSQSLMAAPDTRVVANADDPLVVTAVRGARPSGAGVTWVAAGAPWREDTPICTGCGSPWQTVTLPWGCDACGLSEPATRWSLDGRSACTEAGPQAVLRLGLPGRANLANALMALACAVDLGVDAPAAASAVSGLREVDGRYLRAHRDRRDVVLLLAKNPAGWHEVLDHLTGEAGEADVVIGLNNREADGVDPSWLWDVPFELLQGRSVTVYGECALDLAVRLHYAEVPYAFADDLRAALHGAQGRPTVVAANYTAFVAARRFLRGSPASRLRRA